MILTLCLTLFSVIKRAAEISCVNEYIAKRIRRPMQVDASLVRLGGGGVDHAIVPATAI